MKYLSFSLWGDKPIYNIGAIKNAELWKEIYPDWQMILYYDDTVPINTITSLINLGVKTIDMSNSNIFGCFWRFLISDEVTCEYAVFRDCDSRISLREKIAVDEWINSKKSIHIMRDHPAHRIPYGNDSLGILAGMWGIKGSSIPMKNMIEKYIDKKEDKYGIDQSFLKLIYSIFEFDNLTHDEFFGGKPFPINRKNGRFVGERITEYDKPLTDDFKKVL